LCDTDRVTAYNTRSVFGNVLSRFWDNLAILSKRKLRRPLPDGYDSSFRHTGGDILSALSVGFSKKVQAFHVISHRLFCSN